MTQKRKARVRKRLTVEDLAVTVAKAMQVADRYHDEYARRFARLDTIIAGQGDVARDRDEQPMKAEAPRSYANDVAQTGQVSSPAPPRVIARGFDELGDELRMLHAALEELEKRVGPALGPAAPETTHAAGAPPQAPISTVAIVLAEHTRTVVAARRRVMGLLDRVEL